MREIDGKLSIRRLVPNPKEATVVREAVDRALAGEGVVSIARDFNARGVLPRSGAEWKTSTLTRILRAPQVGGYMPAHREGRNVESPRDSRGRIMLELDTDGAPLQPWEPLVPVQDWHRLQDVLDARPVIRGTAKVPSLLGGGGISRCSLCGSGMGAARRNNGGGSYRCMRQRSGGNCKGTSVAMDHADDYVARAVFARLAALDPEDPDDVDLLLTATERFAAQNADGEDAAQRSALQVAIQTATASLNRLDDDRAAGLFDGETGTARYRRQVVTLTKRLEESQRLLAEMPDNSAQLIPWLDSLAFGDHGPTGPGSPWESWSVAERREFLKLALDHVEVLPPIRRYAGGNAEFRGEERLRIVWASSDLT